MAIHKTEYFSGEGICPEAGTIATYRVLDSKLFCVCCGEDHEEAEAQ